MRPSQLTRATVIWATARGTPRKAEGSAFAPPVPAVIWVSEPDSFADAIGFWNARALVATVASSAIPVTAIFSLRASLNSPDLAELLAPRLPGAIRKTEPDAFIFSHSVPIEQLRVIAQQPDLAEAAPASRSGPRSSRIPRHRAGPRCRTAAAVGLGPTPWCCYPRRYGRGTSELVQVFSGKT